MQLFKNVRSLKFPTTPNSTMKFNLNKISSFIGSTYTFVALDTDSISKYRLLHYKVFLTLLLLAALLVAFKTRGFDSKVLKALSDMMFTSTAISTATSKNYRLLSNSIAKLTDFPSAYLAVDILSEIFVTMFSCATSLLTVISSVDKYVVKDEPTTLSA